MFALFCDIDDDTMTTFDLVDVRYFSTTNNILLGLKIKYLLVAANAQADLSSAMLEFVSN
jgi:hypothetical protein